MKKIVFVFLLTFTTVAGFAQRQGGGNMTAEPRAENQTKTLTENLNLSEDQKKQVYNLSLARAQKVQELRNAQNADRTEMRASMENFNNELSKILTVEQQEKYKTMLEDRRGMRRSGEGPKK
ncbi:hypothetical protein [Dyadobacter sp.]|uniref:hypothetical protein n=1 Tax=Dyadobacter sp. TaxID=1914288 RepID=UPI003F71A277